MSKMPTPKPMPKTGMSDRNDPIPRSDMDMKKGVTFGKMQVTNGKPAK